MRALHPRTEEHHTRQYLYNLSKLNLVYEQLINSPLQ